MSKTEVYSWRVSRARKSALEEAARTERTSVAELLDRVTHEWIRTRNARAADDDRAQARLRAAAMRFVGALQGSDPGRARLARVRLHARLKRRHGG